MTHPSLVTIDTRSAPRTLFSGDQLVDVDLPTGTRVVYSKPPLEPLKDVDAAIRYALNHPLGSDPLHAKLRPGMKVVIAIDDISLPLPPMRRPDVRERVLTVVLGLLADHGVEDVEIIIATSVHRRMTAQEVRWIVGPRIFDAYWPDRLYNHDAEDPKGMKLVGTTDAGFGGPASRTTVGGGGAGCAGGAAEPAVGKAPGALASGAVDAATMSSSKAQVSTTHFQMPFACFLQISRRRPRSETGVPRESPKRSS